MVTAKVKVTHHFFDVSQYSWPKYVVKEPLMTYEIHRVPENNCSGLVQLVINPAKVHFAKNGIPEIVFMGKGSI